MIDESTTHEPYILAQSFNKANIQDRLWYVMEEEDLQTLLDDNKVAFGDKAFVIKTAAKYICGNDATWYDMSSGNAYGGS